jgi:sugar transferase (PEP-CTERM/EpsH1 system associated)
MQILFLAHRVPYPPDKGERIRAFHELEYLGARHDVDLVCLADSEDWVEHRSFLLKKCRSVHAEVLRKSSRCLRAAVNLAAGRPMSFGFFYSTALATTVRELLQARRYDLIFVYSSSMGQYVPWPAPATVVIDFVDADSHKFQQYAARSHGLGHLLYSREARAVASCEQALGRLAAVSFAVTEHDARELEGPGASGWNVRVIPNGVQVPEQCEQVEQAKLRRQQPFLLFVGTMNYPPNSDAAAYFAQDILPLVRKNHSDMNFVIAGRDPDRRVRDLASIPGVTVTGAVLNVFDYFRAAEASVAPFRISQGFHNKIAESLAVGTPAVTTSRARAGIGLSEDEGLFVGDSPEEFAEQISLAVEPGRRTKLRQNVSVVRKLLSWDASLARMEQLILEAIAKSDKSSYQLVSEY